MDNKITERYHKIFEMAFKPDIFESNIIDPKIMDIFKHIIKYRLTVDKSFANNFDKDLFSALNRENLKQYWKKDIHIFVTSLMKDIEMSQIKKGYKDTKEELYLSSLANNFILLSAKHQDIQAIKKATSKYSNNEEIAKKAKRFFNTNSIREFEWMQKTYEFLISIKPIKNKIKSKEEVDSRYEKFIHTF